MVNYNKSSKSKQSNVAAQKHLTQQAQLPSQNGQKQKNANSSNKNKNNDDSKITNATNKSSTNNNNKDTNKSEPKYTMSSNNITKSSSSNTRSKFTNPSKSQQQPQQNQQLKFTKQNSNRNTQTNNNNSPNTKSVEISQNDSINVSDKLKSGKIDMIKMNPGDILTAALTVACTKCSKTLPKTSKTTISSNMLDSFVFNTKQYRKSKSYMGDGSQQHSYNNNSNNNSNRRQYQYQRSLSERRNTFDRHFAERNKGFVPIVPPAKPVLSASNIAAVIADIDKFTIIERLGKGRTSYPIMQCGKLDAPESSYHQQRSSRMDVYQIDDGFHSDGGTETPPPSPSSSASIASTSDHGSLENVDTGGTQRLAVLSFEQVRKLHDVMDEKVAIHGRGNFPTLEVTLKDLVNSVRRKLEADVGSGGAGVIVKDIRLNGGAASHVLASEDQPYNDLDLIYAIELSSSRHFDRVKTAVLNTLLDLLPEGVSKRRIMPCALKEAYVGKMVKVNNNNDGDRWSLISLGNSPGHKNVELKFVDTMRRQFEFSVDSFQIVLDSLLLFYDCAALPISENFYPTVVGESVYGDFQEALYHLQKKLISTRQPEEIRGGGLLKYCNLLVRNYKAVDPQRIKTLERYMCSRFFIDFPDINTQTVKLEAYLRNHFWGIDEEPLQYQYLMHLREVVEMSTVCLMGHERRQTLLLIQSLAAQVLYNEQQKHQQAHAQEHYQQQQQQQQQAIDMQQQQQPQQQQQTVTLVTTQQTPTAAQQTQTIYVQQAPQNVSTATTICCAVSTADQQTQQQQQVNQSQATTSTVPQTIQIQTGPPSLIYANGVYYAPVIPTTICTCNSTWLST